MFIHLAAFLLASVTLASVKTLSPKNDEILEIKTSLGIATIIQLPETIQSAIMGDQSAYRIEYVGQGVTIKPLRGGAKTNLYLFTKEGRYNLRLSVVPQNQAYYIVYIKKSDLGEGPRWTTQGKTAANDKLTIKLLRSGVTQDGFLLLDVVVTAKKPYEFRTSDFWLWQGTELTVIHSLFLSRLQIKKDQIVNVGLAVKRSELKNFPLIVEMKMASQQSLRVEVPKESLWK